MTLNCDFDVADKRARWDDWVPQDRLRKLNDENRELANNLKKELEAMRRGSQAQKSASTSHKKKTEAGSARGSEGRETPVASTSLAGRKRGRDFEVERVGHLTFASRHFALYCPRSASCCRHCLIVPISHVLLCTLAPFLLPALLLFGLSTPFLISVSTQHHHGSHPSFCNR